MSTEEPTPLPAPTENAANLKSDGLSQPTKASTPKAAGASVSTAPGSPSPTSTASASTNLSDSVSSAPVSVPPPPAKEARPAADGHSRPAAKKGEKRAAPKSQSSAGSNSSSDLADGDISMSNPGLNLGGGGGGSKRKRTVAQLKHSQVEQKRRNRMNAHYMELDSLCLQLDPSLTNVKRNRDAVLVNAIRLLKDFQATMAPANSVRNALSLKANGAAAAAAVAALRDGQTNPSLSSAQAAALNPSAADTSKLLDQALFQFRNFPNDAATLLALQQDPLRAQNLAAAAAALTGRSADRLGADNHDRLSQALGAYYHSSFLGGQPQLLSSLQQSGMNLHHLGSTPSPLPPDYMSLHMLSNNSLPGLSAIDRLTGQPNADLNLLRSLANNQSSSSLASMAASMASGNFFPQAPQPPAGPAPAQNHSSSQFMLQ